jgi:hypothetical protein
MKSKPKKTYKYKLTVEFESEVPVKLYPEKLGIQYENGLPYFVESRIDTESVNSSFIYGSGKRKLTKG